MDVDLVVVVALLVLVEVVVDIVVVVVVLGGGVHEQIGSTSSFTLCSTFPHVAIS